MKPFIVGVAIFIMLNFILIFEVDNYDMRLENIHIKNATDEAASSAVLFYDEEVYSQTSCKNFLEKESLKAIDDIILTFLNNNSAIKSDVKISLENVFTRVTFFNDSGICDEYIDDVKVGSCYFEYPFIYEDKEMGYKKLVTDATVIVTLKIGRGNYHMSFLDVPELTRSSGYDYE